MFPERTYEAIARPTPHAAPRASGSGRARDDLGAPSGLSEAREAPSAAPADAEPARRKSGRAESLGAPRASTDNLGTEYGESVSNSVVEVPFRRASPSRPDAVITLRYDDRSGLLARGIALEPPRPRPRPQPHCAPEAFPHSRFAPPPPPSACD